MNSLETFYGYIYVGDNFTRADGLTYKITNIRTKDPEIAIFDCYNTQSANTYSFFYVVNPMFPSISDSTRIRRPGDDEDRDIVKINGESIIDRVNEISYDNFKTSAFGTGFGCTSAHTVPTNKRLLLLK
jgi:hypothetical protein